MSRGHRPRCLGEAASVERGLRTDRASPKKAPPSDADIPKQSLIGEMNVTKTRQSGLERARPRKLRSQATPEARAAGRAEDLMRAALELFAIKDFARITLRDIQEASGFDAAPIYYYFKDKQDLFNAAVKFALAEALDAKHHLWNAERDPVEAIRSWLRHCLTRAEDNRTIFRIMFHYAGWPKAPRGLNRLVRDFYRGEEIDILARNIELGIATGAFQKVDAAGDAISLRYGEYLTGELDVLLQADRALLDVAADLVLAPHDLVEGRVHVAGVVGEHGQCLLGILLDPAGPITVEPLLETCVRDHDIPPVLVFTGCMHRIMVNCRSSVTANRMANGAPRGGTRWSPDRWRRRSLATRRHRASQSAALREQLGYRLFERLGGRLMATSGAHLLYRDADRIFRNPGVDLHAASSLRDPGKHASRRGHAARTAWIRHCADRWARSQPGLRRPGRASDPADRVTGHRVDGELDIARIPFRARVRTRCTSRHCRTPIWTP